MPFMIRQFAASLPHASLPQYPRPPLVIATQKSQINTIPTHTVAWTRPEMPRFKKRRLHGELVPERGILCTNIPKIRAVWVQLGKRSQQM